MAEAKEERLDGDQHEGRLEKDLRVRGWKIALGLKAISERIES